jgi:hypothetical protein
VLNTESWEVQRSLVVLQKGGEEMSTKKESKRDFLAFIEACRDESSAEHKQMIAVIKNKGQDITPEELQKRFHHLKYEDVTLTNCENILDIVKSGVLSQVLNTKKWDFAY